MTKLTSKAIAKVRKTGHCDQKYAGEWEQPIRKGYLLQCCGCGLIHSMDFRIVTDGRGKFIQFRAFLVDKKLKRIKPSR